MMPSEPQRHEEIAESPYASGPVALGRPPYHWYQKMWAVALVAFCLAMGFFLLIFPWMPGWDTNYFASLIPQWHAYWENMYLRGAVSGLGVVNLYIALIELYRLRRFAIR